VDIAERLAALERAMQEYGPRGYAPTGSPAMVPAGIARQARHASFGPMVLGDTRDWDHDPIVLDPALANFTKVPAFYPVVGTLGPDDGDEVTLTTQLRPEPFVLKRITWATNGDQVLDPDDPQEADELTTITNWTQQGRAVECRFGDSFTNFLGRNFALVSALFGDSQGFMDIPGTLLFQGSQNLEVELRRLLWPYQIGPDIVEPNLQNTRWDFVFAGVSLLPPGVNQSGSAG
jgi:hypothetical protein